MKADTKAAEAFVARLDAMMYLDANAWAFHTLDAIRGNVVAHGLVEQRHIDAADGIEAATAREQAAGRKRAAVDDQEGGLPSERRADGIKLRRYEGGA